MNKRNKQEAEENLEQIVNNAPSGRFQNQQQVQNTDDAKVKAPETSFQLEKHDSKGSQLKQEAVAKVIKNVDSGSSISGMGISASGSRSVSGTSGGVLGAANSTPIAEKSRSESRYGKKLDRIATKLNFTPSEQVLEEFDESKPLAESKDSDQGFNGTYRNEYGRSQKKVGNTPAELMFQRSVDLITKDQIYFGQGQVVNQTGVAYHETPTIKAVKNAIGSFEYPTTQTGADVHNYNLKAGNFLHRDVHVTLTEEGKVDEIYFDVDDLTADVDAERANRSSTAALINRNVAELDRQSMDAKAGDEKAEIWTPLARAVKQPTQLVGMLRDFEAITGNEVLLAYRKASTSMSYQLNRAAKDGQTIVDPGVEALLGVLEDANTSGVLSAAYPDLASVLDGKDSDVKKLNAAGSSGLMLQMYDSTGKYSSKQDLILQPRAFRMHLQTADNNMNPLRADKRFAQVINGQEVFSTIDREYDPLLPICMTDKAAIVHRYDFNQLIGRRRLLNSFKFKTDVSASTEFKTEVILDGRFTKYGSQDTYYVHVLLSDDTVGHGAFEEDDGVIYPNTATDANGIVVIIIDDSATQIASKTIGGVTYYEHQDPFSYDAGESAYLGVPTDAIEVKKNFIQTPADGGDYTYMYTDLRNNYVVTTNVPLLTGIIRYLEDSIGAKMYTLLPKGSITIPMVHSTQYFSLWSFLVCAATPFIINERINAMRDVLYYEKNVEYPFSQLTTIGDIGVKSYANFTYDGYDNPLVTGVMKPTVALKWTIPEMFWKPYQKRAGNVTTDSIVVMPFYMNENNYTYLADGTCVLNEDAAAMSMPSIRSGVRLSFLDQLYSMSEKDIRLALDCAIPFVPLKATKGFVYKYGSNTDGIAAFKLEDESMADITIKEWLTVPREIGYVIDVPYGVLTPKVTGSVTKGIISTRRVSLDTESATRGTSFRIKCWAGSDYIKHTTGSGSQEILNPAAVNINRAANFKQVWYEIVSNGKQPAFDAGMLFSLNNLLTNGSVAMGESLFVPFINEKAQFIPSGVTVISFMKGLWTRLQKLPFVVSPFEGTDASSNGTYGQTFDPYEIAYLFGMAGMRASDYRESVYNREKEAVNQGYLYVNDDWTESSPIFREGSISSGVTVTKGYEI